jgi:hypothetical protein
MMISAAKSMERIGKNIVTLSKAESFQVRKTNRKGGRTKPQNSNSKKTQSRFHHSQAFTKIVYYNFLKHKFPYIMKAKGIKPRNILKIRIIKWYWIGWLAWEMIN